MALKQFNIRIYGILINSDNQVLLSDERVKGREITKFPGGGLELGEGGIDCLKREFIEETANEIEVIEHFYTTDFFQKSAFSADQQIISIYYIVKPASVFKIKTTERKFDFSSRFKYEQLFRWRTLNEINENDFTLPIDKVVGKMLKDKYRS